jgi:hypothetical protein
MLGCEVRAIVGWALAPIACDEVVSGILHHLQPNASTLHKTLFIRLFSQA